MKILAFVDMHGSLRALEKIKEQSKKADLIVCAGDISIFSNSLDGLLSELNKLNKTVLIIPGNHELDEDLNELSKFFNNVIDIHKKSFVKDEYLFLGYGGSGFLMVEKKLDKVAKKFEKIIKKFKGKEKSNKKVILVTHAPPYKTNLDNLMGEPCGNKSIRNLITKTNPDIVITGHLHENAGKEDKIGKTKLINPGPFGKVITI